MPHQSTAPGLAALTLLGNMLEMQIRGPHPAQHHLRPGVEWQQSAFSRAFQELLTRLDIGEPLPQELGAAAGSAAPSPQL